MAKSQASTGAVRSYRDLRVWRRGIDLVVCTYRITKVLPRNERYGLVTQMQRAAVSIPANIAEGHGREHLRDYLRHLSFANGSLMELETYIVIGQRLRYLSSDQMANTLTDTAELGRMLAALVNKLKAKLR